MVRRLSKILLVSSKVSTLQERVSVFCALASNVTTPKYVPAIATKVPRFLAVLRHRLIITWKETLGDILSLQIPGVNGLPLGGTITPDYQTPCLSCQTQFCQPLTSNYAFTSFWLGGVYGGVRRMAGSFNFFERLQRGR